MDLIFYGLGDPQGYDLSWCYADRKAEDVIEREFNQKHPECWQAPDLIKCNVKISQIPDGIHKGQLYGHEVNVYKWSIDNPTLIHIGKTDLPAEHFFTAGDEIDVTEEYKATPLGRLDQDDTYILKADKIHRLVLSLSDDEASNNWALEKYNKKANHL